MKAKVLKRFRDKETKQVYAPKGKTNSVYEGSEERVKEIASKGYVEIEVHDDHSSILDGNVEEVKKNADGLTVKEAKELLEAEKSDKNRSGVVNHFESLIEAAEGKPPEEGE
ncbi:hypothetical protein SAMN04487943_101305 [Gracilibacillus orientalis]|uniref:Uncharacterized protein n=1 Tax=Gracilibacillus orientalis TaxID=334253 RepID=A0A1I4H9I3_9BACI|nr:hypothetical protein [Gracilibacillus orientalis]SFL38959.1 hypothetical protein SAMN04487943_101305 [Gracilibacillus orientalis]